MSTFAPERLKSARLLAGLSLRQLAEGLSGRISYSAINKYEKWQMQPDAGTILRLAECLKVRPSYFFETNILALGAINFRKRSVLSQMEIERIRELARDKVQRSLGAEMLLGLNFEFQNPIAKKQVREIERAEEMADTVRAAWGLGSNAIPNVIEMLEENEVKVIEVGASDHFDGLSAFTAHGVPVIVVNEGFTAERKRFTALHELGHLMMRLNPGIEIEKACHRFAGSLLFPAKEVRRVLGDKRRHIAMGELAAIKEEYGISVQAAMRRALDLGIIQPLAFRQFHISIAGNKKEMGLGAFPGEEKSRRLSQMVFRLFAEGAIDESRAASLAGLKTEAFRSLYYNIPLDEIKAPYEMAGSAFANAWGEDEPEYSVDDVKEINPDYEGW
jgi:Zn-dependent peptidase ImmA (M78 family)